MNQPLPLNAISSVQQKLIAIEEGRRDLPENWGCSSDYKERAAGADLMLAEVKGKDTTIEKVTCLRHLAESGLEIENLIYLCILFVRLSLCLSDQQGDLIVELSNGVASHLHAIRSLWLYRDPNNNMRYCDNDPGSARRLAERVERGVVIQRTACIEAMEGIIKRVNADPQRYGQNMSIQEIIAKIWARKKDFHNGSPSWQVKFAVADLLQ